MRDIHLNETTAYYRCSDPELSLDQYSQRLCTKEGVEKAQQIQRDVYPAVSRHICVRARHFYETIKIVLAMHDVDAVISLGSGFSLLTYYLSEDFPRVQFIDSDVATVLKARKDRIRELQKYFGPQILHVEQKIFDVSKLAKAKGEIKNFFPYKKPLFVMEGMSYYLTSKELQWLFDSFHQYNQFFCMYDYWPSTARRSLIFNKMISLIENQEAGEAQITVVKPEDFQKMEGAVHLVEDKGLDEIEKKWARQPYELEDPNETVPSRFRVISKNT
ncbi:MAG: class I SAM-dependent methyltransferase [Bdellovibrionota bacterium]